jgi:spore coat polysaccharide biosynthesis protein SpsF
VTRRLVAALACRINGSRLYGKPLQNLDVENGLTILDYQIAFLQTERIVDDIVLGVADGPANAPFHALARRQGIRSISGDETDVLRRLIQCGEAAGATDVLRITTESPFTYFEPLPEAWRRHVAHDHDVTAVTDVPDGAGFEILAMRALATSHARGDRRHRSELCTLYIREHLDQFRVDALDVPPDVRRLDLRLTVDYPEDLILCRRVYERFKDSAPRIPLRDIVEYLDASPELLALVRPYALGEKLYS